MAAAAEISEQIGEKLREREAIDVELKQLYAKNEILKRQAVMHARNRPKASTGVKAYLDRQKESRAVRAHKHSAGRGDNHPVQVDPGHAPGLDSHVRDDVPQKHFIVDGQIRDPPVLAL